MQEVFKVKRRCIYGEKKKILMPGDVIDLPDKEVTSDVVKRLTERGAGVVMSKADYDKELAETDKGNK